MNCTIKSCSSTYSASFISSSFCACFDFSLFTMRYYKIYKTKALDFPNACCWFIDCQCWLLLSLAVNFSSKELAHQSEYREISLYTWINTYCCIRMIQEIFQVVFRLQELLTKDLGKRRHVCIVMLAQSLYFPKRWLHGFAFIRVQVVHAERISSFFDSLVAVD